MLNSYYNYTACLFTIGITAAGSKQNLSDWLDTVVVQHSPGSVVRDANGRRISGLFHQMARNVHSDVPSILILIHNHAELGG